MFVDSERDDRLVAMAGLLSSVHAGQWLACQVASLAMEAGVSLERVSRSLLLLVLVRHAGWVALDEQRAIDELGRNSVSITCATTCAPQQRPLVVGRVMVFNALRPSSLRLYESPIYRRWAVRERGGGGENRR